MSCHHMWVPPDSHCVRCYERADAVDVEWFDLRAEQRTPLAVLRAGPGARHEPDRPTYYPPGGAA